MPGAFTYLPRQSGYNKRLRAAMPLLKHIIRMLALDTDLWIDVSAECGYCVPAVAHHSATVRT